MTSPATVGLYKVSDTHMAQDMGLWWYQYQGFPQETPLGTGTDSFLMVFLKSTWPNIYIGLFTHYDYMCSINSVLTFSTSLM